MGRAASRGQYGTQIPAPGGPEVEGQRAKEDGQAIPIQPRGVTVP